MLSDLKCALTNHSLVFKLVSLTIQQTLEFVSARFEERLKKKLGHKVRIKVFNRQRSALFWS